MEDAAAFARLIHAIRPWLGHLVIVGGWAHRLHRLHPCAGSPGYMLLGTRDVDVALSLEAPLAGNMREALEGAGFTTDFKGNGAPPVTHYRLGGEDQGFFAEFLVPLRGSEVKRSGELDVTVTKAGINAQKLRHLDLLLVTPWSVRVGPHTEVPFDVAADILVPNPVSFIVQRLLIHDKRRGLKKAQDVLYIHDTLELFGAVLDDLTSLRREQVRPRMSGKTALRAEKNGARLFAEVTDTIREAARIPQDRRLTPEIVRAACEYGLDAILRG